MIGEMIDAGRHPTPLEIQRRANDMERVIAQAPSHQTRVVEHPGANDRVKALLDHIHQPIGELQVELDFGVARHEPRQLHKHHVTDLGHADPQAPFRRLGGHEQFLLGRFQLVENASAAFQKHRPFSRQIDAAGIAVEQPRTELLLHTGDAFAHC